MTDNKSPDAISLDDVYDVDMTGAPQDDNAGASQDDNVDDNADDNADDDTPPDTSDTGDNSLDTDENKAKIQGLFSNFADENAELTDVQIKTKAQLLKDNNGTSFDAEGNIIDENGEVVKSFEDIYKSVISNDSNTDDEGNVVDKDGNIVKTALEVAAEKSYVNKLHLNSEFEFTDENGKVKIYSDDENGLQEYADDVANERFRVSQETFVKENKVAIDIAKHLALGGKIEDYNASIEWDKLNAKDLSKEDKLGWIRKSFKAANFSDARIDNLIDLIDKGNTIDADFEKAVEHLKGEEEAARTARDLAYREKLEEDERKAVNHWNNVKDLITNDKVAIVQIPKNEKEAFYKYVSEAVDNQGNSQDNVDAAKLSTEEKLALSYMRFKKLNLKELVKQEVRSKRAESLTDLIMRSSNIKNSATTSSSTNKGGGNDDSPAVISVSDLLG